MKTDQKCTKQQELLDTIVKHSMSELDPVQMEADIMIHGMLITKYDISTGKVTRVDPMDHNKFNKCPKVVDIQKSGR